MTNNQTKTTVASVLEPAEGSHLALVTPDGKSLTYDQLTSQVTQLSQQLISLGINPDDRVAIILPNSIEEIVTFLAVSSVATAAPLNSAYKPDEFRFYLEDTDAKAIITSPSEGAEAVRVAKKDTLHITISGNDNNELNLSCGNITSANGSETEISSSDVALVLHTSGTTSTPKRVPLTHGNLITSMINVAETYQLSREDVSLCIMPLFHVHGLVASTLATLHSGGTVVIPPKFNPLRFWPLIEEFGVTWFSGVPSMHQALLARAKSNPYPKSDTLRFIRSCSASLPPNIMKDLEAQFGVPVVEAYGMTEAAHQMTSNPLPPAGRVPGSVGPGTGVEIAIMNEAGQLQPNETKGEVVIKGANVTEGYENNPEANAASFVNGWFRTGDEGILGSTGYLTLTGRIKELINRSGEKISPREIDEVLLDHPAVVEAVAFGIPHPIHGEEPAAVVVLSEQVSASELVTYCRTRLANFKCPREIRVVNDIPKGATGKLQRRAVAAAFSKLSSTSC